MNGERGFADSAERCSLTAGQIEFADFAGEEGAHQVTTPDHIEKLREALDLAMKTLRQHAACKYEDLARGHVNEVLNKCCELLADYERLLREREKWTEREEEVIAELMNKHELSRHAVLRQGLRLFQLLVEEKIVLPNLAAEQPPAVSEERRED